MNTRDVLVEQWQAEYAGFVRVLEAVPPDKADYRPYAGAPSALDLARLVVRAQSLASTLVDRAEAQWHAPGTPRGFRALADVYRRDHAGLIHRLRLLDARAWDAACSIILDGGAPLRSTLGHLLWLLLRASLHYRGQLSVYVEAAGGASPALYQPVTGDALQSGDPSWTGFA